MSSSITPSQHLLRPAAPLAPAVRLLSCPPRRTLPKVGLWHDGLAWLRSQLQPGREAADPVRTARQEFELGLADIGTQEAFDLSARIVKARSLRELWHMRTPLFGIVARERSQPEAERRLRRLNRHFPTRAPLSGFTPLEP